MRGPTISGKHRQLDAAEKQSDRVGICKQIVEMSEHRELIAVARKEAARATEADVRKFMARRLEAEINLERARIKQAEEKPAGKEQIEESTKKTKELQKERIATLKESVRLFNLLAKAGRLGNFDDALEERQLLLKAELDAVTKESDRIALYKKFIDAMKEHNELASTLQKKFVEEMKEDGESKEPKEGVRVTETVMRKIKARRLEAEINLEQAKIREAKVGK